MVKTFNPKVSIIIPVYNGSNYIKEAIKSALAQTYKNLEIVVVNDGSNDDGKTDKICMSYGNKIRYFKKENGGVSSALNLGIKEMTGEYFSWLSHDDIYSPDKIEKQIKFLSKYSQEEKIVLYADYQLINENGKFVTNNFLDHQMLIRKPEYALLRGSVNGITLLIPKKAFEQYGLFDESLKCTQDYDMWRRIMQSYTFIHMEEVFTKTRIHPLQDSNKHPNVTKEGNPLWIEMMESVSLERKKILEGTEYNFYKEMSIFLKGTPYEEAEKYAEEKMNLLFGDAIKRISSIKVSVVIPFYNRISELYKSLDSVVNQTHKNLEIILVNDGSDDKLVGLKKYIKSDKRIRLIELERNSGPAVARNYGLEEASGEYIAFLDSDDLFMENKIEEQLALMFLSASNVSHTSYIRKCGKSREIIFSGRLFGKVIPQIISNCPIATPTVMLKTDYIKKKKFKYREDFKIGEDICFWLEILRDQKLFGIEEPYSVVNVNKNSAINSSEKQLIGLSNILRFVVSDKDFGKYYAEINQLCNVLTKISSQLVEKNNSKKSEVVEPERNWSLLRPIEIFSKLISLFRYQGVLLTMKKITWKYAPKAFNKIKSIFNGKK
jgi:hypothetical protein